MPDAEDLAQRQRMADILPQSWATAAAAVGGATRPSEPGGWLDGAGLIARPLLVAADDVPIRSLIVPLEQGGAAELVSGRWPGSAANAS